MNRNELESFIKETYNADANYPWFKYPNYEVFRHSSNQKWFALIMDVPKSKLGLQGAVRISWRPEYRRFLKATNSSSI